MGWNYWIEERLPTGELVTIPFETKEEMEEYIKNKEKLKNEF